MGQPNPNGNDRKELLDTVGNFQRGRAEVTASPQSLWSPTCCERDSYLCSVVRATVLTFHDDCTFG